MKRRVYFAFHYQDVIDFRANVVRKAGVVADDDTFFDASLWEESKKKGAIALKRLINSGLDYTSTTAVLIGSETYARPWVRYEIFKSFERGNALLGVHINSIPDKNRRSWPSPNIPTTSHKVTGDTFRMRVLDVHPTLEALYSSPDRTSRKG